MAIVKISFPGLRLSFFIALRSLRKGNVGTNVLTILIMSLVFINFIFLSAIFGGSNDLFVRQLRDTALGDVYVEPQEGEEYLENPDSIQRRIEGVPGVRATASRYVTGAQINHDNRKGTWQLWFINPEDETDVSIFDDCIVEGSYLDRGDVGEVVLGKEITGGYGAFGDENSLGGVSAGDMVTIYFNNGFSKEYEIKGIFNTKYLTADEVALLTKEDMEEVLGYSDRATIVIARVFESRDLDFYVSRIRATSINGIVKSYKDNIGIVSNFTGTLTILNAVLSTVAFFVATVVLFIVVYINTRAKRRQIGVLKALGVPDLVIINSFTFQAVFLSVVGVILGVFLMYFGVVPFFEANPLTFPVGDVYPVIDPLVVIEGLIGLTISAIIAGIVPSYNATREPILESIWSR